VSKVVSVNGIFILSYVIKCNELLAIKESNIFKKVAANKIFTTLKAIVNKAATLLNIAKLNFIIISSSKVNNSVELEDSKHYTIVLQRL